MPVGLYCRSAREPNWSGFDDSAGEVAADTNRVDLVRVFLCVRLTLIVSIILTIVLSQLSWAGGPRYYYTDQGNLSPVLPGPSAPTHSWPTPSANGLLLRQRQCQQYAPGNSRRTSVAPM